MTGKDGWIHFPDVGNHKRNCEVYKIVNKWQRGAVNALSSSHTRAHCPYWQVIFCHLFAGRTCQGSLFWFLSRFCSHCKRTTTRVWLEWSRDPLPEGTSARLFCSAFELSCSHVSRWAEPNWGLIWNVSEGPRPERRQIISSLGLTFFCNQKKKKWNMLF